MASLAWQGTTASTSTSTSQKLDRTDSRGGRLHPHLPMNGWVKLKLVSANVSNATCIAHAAWFTRSMSGWVALPVALAALFVSALTFRDRRRTDRRDLLLRLYDQLIKLDLQRGRRLLAETSGADWWETVDREILDEINRVLGTWDIVGWYVENDHVDAGDFMSLWRRPVITAWERGEGYINFRRARENRPDLWPYLERMYLTALRHDAP